ncbi:MAG: hypothetical protein PHQ89_00395 [Bacilli bacterium]|nr:hypothetical protein [Bacilli bacterium]
MVVRDNNLTLEEVLQNEYKQYLILNSERLNFTPTYENWLRMMDEYAEAQGFESYTDRKERIIKAENYQYSKNKSYQKAA